ncbi:PIN domain-containing protein [Candidatus Woesearchaeota archaeon]|nr:PIN domain-containing protein [Candidatus Woesearchaeota archaeon]
MNYIDSNVIAYAFYENEFRDSCRNVLRSGGLINTINLVEAFNIIELQTSRETAVKAIKGLIKSNIIILDVDFNIIFEALKRAEKYTKLTFLDLVHYTSALLNNCNSIISYDKDFDDLEIIRKEKL